MLDLYNSRPARIRPGDTVRGRVVAVTGQVVYLDIDRKTEAKIPLEQFLRGITRRPPQLGETVEAVVESRRDADGLIRLSVDKCRFRLQLEDLERLQREETPVSGRIIRAVPGGLSVDIGSKAFLPASLIDLHPVPDPVEWVGAQAEFLIIQITRSPRNVVVSRRAFLEKDIDAIRRGILPRMKSGAVVEGAVKNITDFGVFFDLSGIDGLLHKTDISWGRVRHPSDHFRLGQHVKLLILHFDPLLMRVCLGYKQMFPDPWIRSESRFPLGSVVDGRVTCFISYGAFVEIAPGIEGLLHDNELSWNGERQTVLGRLKIGGPVRVQVLHIDESARRLSLSMKRVVQ